MSSKNLITLAPVTQAPQQAVPISLTKKIEGVRTSLRLVQRDIQAVEGRFLDFDTAETLQRLCIIPSGSSKPSRSAWPFLRERG